MFTIRCLGVALSLLVASLPQSTEDTPPTLSKDPLTAEQIAIYRTFLENYVGAPPPLHLANRTEALPIDEADDSTEDDSDARCLKDFKKLKLVNEKEAGTVVHTLDPSLATKDHIILVDPDAQGIQVKANDPSKTMREGKTSEDAVNQAFATGLLTMSEIVFDQRHRVAIMSFSFWCGRTCGHGAVLLFKKTGKRWKISKRPCVEWIS
ncbi:MAG TPA: hypothetical protein VKH81_18390 [Candidatus Angelobacter sp.]|nr:hypothetical protein [Candidatus Angelobacter sp.]